MNSTNIMTALKGILVGGTMLVPGVSGGSMAIILGIYDKLVSSVSSFRKHKGESFLFLSLFAIGGAVGMFLFASPLQKLIERYPMPMLYFFLGAVLGGIPLIFKQAQIKTFSWKIPLYIVLGVFTVFLFSMLPAGTFQPKMNAGISDFLILTAAGFIAALALVLPGISVSYLLLLMGLYDVVIGAVSSLHLAFLIPLGIGLMIGIVLTTKVLEKAMNRYPQPTYLIILGFIVASIFELFPGIPSGGELFLCILTLAAGFLAIRLLSFKGTKNVTAVHEKQYWNSSL